MLQQLPLNVRLKDNESFETYFSGRNGAVVYALEQMASGQGDQQLFIWGSQQGGKTHLLHAACHAAATAGRSTLLLKAEDLLSYGPDVFEGLEQLNLVCIDDLQQLMGLDAWELALFNFINSIRAQGGCLVLAAEANPGELSVQLPDLRSRLEWGAVFQLQSLSDEEKIQALQLRADYRGLDLPDEVGSYLLKKYPRDLQHLMHVLEELDVASLAAKRRLTVPFIRSVLA
jgi:DnaA family protein